MDVDEADIEELRKRLYKNESFLGGNEHCYKNEKKTRTFVDEVLKFVCNYVPEVYTDMETEIKPFGETRRPDYCIMRREGNKPLYIIEVKRTEGVSSQLLSELPQHMKQLRFICI